MAAPCLAFPPPCIENLNRPARAAAASIPDLADGGRADGSGCRSEQPQVLPPNEPQSRAPAHATTRQQRCPAAWQPQPLGGGLAAVVAVAVHGSTFMPSTDEEAGEEALLEARAQDDRVVLLIHLRGEGWEVRRRPPPRRHTQARGRRHRRRATTRRTPTGVAKSASGRRATHTSDREFPDPPIKYPVRIPDEPYENARGRSSSEYVPRTCGLTTSARRSTSAPRPPRGAP